jgi:hypothetical protein
MRQFSSAGHRSRNMGCTPCVWLSSCQPLGIETQVATQVTTRLPNLRRLVVASSMETVDLFLSFHELRRNTCLVEIENEKERF